MVTPGPMVLEIATFLMYTPLDAAGFDRTI
jgi:hypothetical protein